MLNKAKHKTSLNKKGKQNTKVMHTQKQEKEREEKWLSHFEPFSFHTLEEPFCLENPWSSGRGEELKPFKFERIMRALRRSPKGAREDGNLF